MNFLDFLLIVIVGYSIFTGFVAGFARVSIGFGATIAGILCGLWFYRIPGAFFQEYLGSATAANLLGFFVVFAAIVLFGGLLSKVLSKAFKWVGLSWLDRLMGAGFGFVRGAVLAVAVVTVITAFAPKPPPGFIVNSKMLPYAAAAGNVFAAIAPHELKEGYHQSLANLRDIWEGVKSQAKPGKLKKESD